MSKCWCLVTQAGQWPAHHAPLPTTGSAHVTTRHGRQLLSPSCQLCTSICSRPPLDVGPNHDALLTTAGSPHAHHTLGLYLHQKLSALLMKDRVSPDSAVAARHCIGGEAGER